MLRLAQKAFFPGKIPFPLLHIDTSYKFPEMIEAQPCAVCDWLRPFRSPDLSITRFPLSVYHSGTQGFLIFS
jgi:hypothetical protein